MTETIDYVFKIDGLTPDEMPFGRLVSYYSHIKAMLGVADNIHLVGIFKSSHASAFKIDGQHRTAIDRRMMALREGTAPKAACRARDTINEMLREDGTSGSFASSSGLNAIHFLGRTASAEVRYSVREAASFVGELYYIAGAKDDEARVRLSTDAYGTVFCTSTREVARGLRDFLFESVRVTGRGTWTRLADTWTVQDFAITDFERVSGDSLRATVNRLRKRPIDWPDDPIGEVDRIEEKSGGSFH